MDRKGDALARASTDLSTDIFARVHSQARERSGPASANACSGGQGGAQGEKEPGSFFSEHSTEARSFDIGEAAAKGFRIAGNTSIAFTTRQVQP